MNVRIALEKWHFAMALHLPGRVGNLEFLPLIYSNGPKNRRKKNITICTGHSLHIPANNRTKKKKKTENKILLY